MAARPLPATTPGPHVDAPRPPAHAQRIHRRPAGAVPLRDRGCQDAKSRGLQFEVPADKRILELLLENGIDAPYGCMQGSCGLCETAVLDGTPEHRDNLLSREVKASKRCALICCARSATPSLTLDVCPLTRQLPASGDGGCHAVTIAADTPVWPPREHP